MNAGIKKIFKSDINKLLEHANKKWQVYAPFETPEGDTLFSFLPKGGHELKEALCRLNLKDEWQVISPKDIFFPQVESMFWYGISNENSNQCEASLADLKLPPEAACLNFDRVNISEVLEESPKLIFGIRPCDTKGLLFSDEFFKRKFEDIYYLSRARDRLIVTIGCLNPPRPRACFCTSADTGPFIDTGYDLQLVDCGDSYFVEAGSEKGNNFVKPYDKFFKDAGKNSLDKIMDIKNKAADNIKTKVDFKKALELMSGNSVFEENYKRIGERCIYCGACLYTCPTCTCFNVFDDKNNDRGVRKRNWDACIFEGYTREASGHNPRDKKWLRTARRYEHKLKYDYRLSGMSGCVACGRCLASCPVEIGMSKFIEEITLNTKKI